MVKNVLENNPNFRFNNRTSLQNKIQICKLQKLLFLLAVHGNSKQL